ncbi:MAG: hypothetical protein WC273_04155 [Dehalococcoidia bacterium]
MTADAGPSAHVRDIVLLLPLYRFDGPPRIEIAEGLAIVEARDARWPATHAVRRTLRLPVAPGGGAPRPEDAAAYTAAREDLWIVMRALHAVALGRCYGERVVQDAGSASQHGWRMPVLPSLDGGALDGHALERPGSVDVIRWCLEEPARRLLRVPLRRLHSALRRSSDEARLVDLLSGLESMLLPHFDADLALRFAVRGSSLLGANLDERQQIFLRLRTASRERDRVLRHEDDAITTPLEALTDDLRRCIRICAERMALTHEPLTAYITGLETELML